MQAIEEEMTLGQTFQQAFILNPEISEGFIAIFNDNNPLHISESFAQAYGFPKKVAHGNILNGFLSYFIGECLPIKNLIIHSQSISYNKPVYVKEKVNLMAKVNQITESVKAIEFKFWFTNTKGEKVAKGRFQIGILTPL